MKKREYIEILVNAGVSKEVAEKALLAIDKDVRKEIPKKGEVRWLIIRGDWDEYQYWLSVCQSIPIDATYDITTTKE